MKRLKTPLSGSPVQDETSIRTVLVFCFLVLLMLFGGIGYWSSRSYLMVEQEIENIHQTDSRYAQMVLQISATASALFVESRNVFATMDRTLMNLSARNSLKSLKEDMDEHIVRVRKTGMNKWPEWQEFERSFAGFWEAVEAPETTDWDERRRAMLLAINQLNQRVENAQNDNAKLTYDLSIRRSRTMLAATIAAVSFGMLVAFLTFYEIQRILARLRRAYQSSAESRDYLQSLFDSMISGGVVIDKEGVVQNISGSFRKLPSLSERLTVGESYKSLFSDAPSMIEIITEDIKRQSPDTRYCGRIGPFGNRVFDLFCSPLVISGEYQGMILGFVDITEIESAQSELRRNRALAVVGQMTTQIAHEIKNPLGSIRFAADLLKRNSAITEKDGQTLDVINRSVEHLTRIVSELSEFARPKSLNQSDLDINELLDSLAPMLADRLNEKSLVIEKEFSPDLPTGYYDATELRKLFLNLIINAIDASEPSGRIRLKTSTNGDGMLSVSVIDAGCGMDKETLMRLFEPFYTTKNQGTGLGMAIAKKIAELHRGDLTVASRKGAGTTVIVRLPIDHMRSGNSPDAKIQTAEA